MFYKETNLKETPIGKIPKDWEIVRIHQLCKVRRGASPRPIKDPSYFSDSGRGWIRISDVTNTYKYLRKTTQYLSEKGISKSVKVNPRDLIMSICATIGKPIILDMEACIHDGFVWFSELSNKVNTEYLFYVLQMNEIKFVNMKQTGTQGNLNTTLVGRIHIPLPPLPEQQKIVEILSTVDTAIQKVDEVIAKTERLKKGLMQELLTKGIGHKEFKETPIGKIPKTWQVVRLGDEGIAKIRGGKKLNGFDKVVFITMEHVLGSGIFTKYEIRDVKDVRSHTYCEAGDLLLSKITPCFENGKQGIVPQEVPNGFALATTEVFPIICEGIDPMFLFYILKFNKFRKILEFSMRGTTGRQRVPKGAVEKLRIPLPPKEEREKIARVLLTVDKKLEIERKNKEKLQKIKQGLMDSLLTGKIRVRGN